MPEDQKQNQLFESVSALVDNQASPLELQRLLAHAEKNTGLRTRWHRYHLARAIMRGEAKGLITADISDKVRAAIADLDIEFEVKDTADTATVPANTRSGVPHWVAPFGKVAIAASVALAVVIGAQQIPLRDDIREMDLAAGTSESGSSNYQRADLSNNPNLARLNVQNVSSASFTTPVDNARVQSTYDARAQRRQQWEEEQVRQAINRLMLEHAQQSSLDQSVGLMPFIRVSDNAFITEASQ